MTGIYFSGTGNTKYCVNLFLSYYGSGADSVAIEDEYAVSKLAADSDILLAYPVYYSNMPKIMREFIQNNGNLFAGKRVFLLATQALFSGDGTGYTGRILRKYGAVISGGLQVLMPDCIGDVPFLLKSDRRNREIVHTAEKKIKSAVNQIHRGRFPQEGLGFFARTAGFVGQRMWFGHRAMRWFNKIKINADTCIGCGLCVKVCPVHNLSMVNRNPVSAGKCTMCYRCFSCCPRQSITLIGKKVYEQFRIERYTNG